MLCDRCGKNEATIHYISYVNDEKTESHICSSCAAKTNMKNILNTFTISDLFDGFFDAPSVKPAADNPMKCSKCGMTINEFRNSGRLGCADCYKAFEATVLPIVKKVQGHNMHTGSFPKGAGKKYEKRRLEDELKEKLNEAVRREDYEQAAVLRDKIKSLQKGGK